MELKPFVHLFFIQRQKQNTGLLQPEKTNIKLLGLVTICFKNLILKILKNTTGTVLYGSMIHMWFFFRTCQS